jgi:hypothetical protein
MDWVYDDTPSSEYGDTIKKYVYSRSKNKQLSKNTERIISLYNFLKSHQFKNPKELRNSVFLDKNKREHIFSEDQSKLLFRMLKTQKGGNESGADTADKVADKVIDAARSVTPEFIKGPIDTVTPYVLILRTVERAPALGPFISIWLDAATATLPVIATTIQNITPTIVGFLPIPEAGPIGSMIGWGMSAMFIFMAIGINMSRGHFGEGFINSFLLIPFVGTSLHNAAIKGEKFVTNLFGKRKEVIKSAEYVPIIGSTISRGLDSIIPTLDPPAAAAAGGKRFSTMKRKPFKWPKTIRRRKSVKH